MYYIDISTKRDTSHSNYMYIIPLLEELQANRRLQLKSAFVSVISLGIFQDNSGQFPAMFVLTKSDILNESQAFSSCVCGDRVI